MVFPWNHHFPVHLRWACPMPASPPCWAPWAARVPRLRRIPSPPWRPTWGRRGEGVGGITTEGRKGRRFCTLDLSLSLYIYISIYTHVYISLSIYLYVYIFIHTHIFFMVNSHEHQHMFHGILPHPGRQLHWEIFIRKSPVQTVAVGGAPVRNR